MGDRDDFFETFCRGVLGKDHFIRFAAISNHLGHLVATSYRKDLVPLMTQDETARYSVQAAIRAATREAFETKIGELQFSISRYSRLVRATVPIKSSGKNKFLLLLGCRGRLYHKQKGLPLHHGQQGLLPVVL
jgi:hypothetical protein